MLLKQQLTTILKARELEDAKTCCHPIHGLPGTSKFLSAYELNQWFDHKIRPPAQIAKFKELEPPVERCPLEAQRRQVIAAAHAVSAENGTKLSLLLEQAANECEDPELRDLLFKSARRFEHLPAPKYTTKETRLGR